MSKVIKVLHILTTDKYSGAENVACQIIKGLEVYGNKELIKYESFYCSPDGHIREVLSEKGITFIPLKKWSLINLKEAVSTVKPDIVHAHDMKATFYSVLVCLGQRIPVFSHIHNNNYDSRKLTLKALLFFVSSYKVKHIFWVSKSSFEGYYYSNQLKEKSSILLNVVDKNALWEKAHLDPQSYNYDVVYLGRLSYPKDPLRLLDVFYECKKLYPSFRAAIIGNGELENAVKDKIKQLKLDEQISLLGFRSNPYKILKCAKVMLMTSRWEGLPMCALEAMTLGVPIVSTPTDGIVELVDNGITGYLAADNACLAKKTIELITDNNLQKIMSKGCLEKADELLNMSEYIDKIINQYEKYMQEY